MAAFDFRGWRNVGSLKEPLSATHVLQNNPYLSKYKAIENISLRCAVLILEITKAGAC